MAGDQGLAVVTGASTGIGYELAKCARRAAPEDGGTWNGKKLTRSDRAGVHNCAWSRPGLF